MNTASANDLITINHERVTHIKVDHIGEGKIGVVSLRGIRIVLDKLNLFYSVFLIYVRILSVHELIQVLEVKDSSRSITIPRKNVRLIGVTHKNIICIFTEVFVQVNINRIATYFLTVLRWGVFHLVNRDIELDAVYIRVVNLSDK